MHSGKINNVYTDFFEGNMPMPHADWLELSYISFENSKVFDNSLKQKNTFKKYSQGTTPSLTFRTENIQNAFNSLFTNLSVVKVLASEAHKRPFTLVADGRIFQDVLKFHISTTKLKKSFVKSDTADLSSIKNLNLPIMSFLPFKV